MNSNITGTPSLRRSVAITIACMAVLPGLTGCGGSGYGGGSTGTMGAGSLAPAITMGPANVTVAAGQPATFSVSATGYSPISYQWKRDNVDIAGATQPSYTLAATTPADNGATFAVKASNAYGTVTSSSATLTVQ